MSVNGKFDAITAADLPVVASRFGVPAPLALIEQVVDATARWAEWADAAGLNSADADGVAKLLVKEAANFTRKG